MRLVTRTAWGARDPNCTDPVPPITAVVVHYSAMNADEQADHANCAARVRGIQNYHMNTKGWCDIAYNFVLCKHGYVFVGRGWDNRSGATGDANDFSIAICFLGDDTEGRDDVTLAGRTALADFLRTAVAHYPGAQVVTGHRKYMSTSCPGDELWKFVTSGAWKTLGNRVRFELWVGSRRIAYSHWVTPGGGRVLKKFNEFYGKVQDKVRYETWKGRMPRFRRRKG